MQPDSLILDHWPNLNQYLELLGQQSINNTIGLDKTSFSSALRPRQRTSWPLLGQVFYLLCPVPACALPLTASLCELCPHATDVARSTPGLSLGSGRCRLEGRGRVR